MARMKQQNFSGFYRHLDIGMIIARLNARAGRSSGHTNVDRIS